MAAPDGTISVELRLITEAAQKQMREAAAAMAKEMAKVGATYPQSKMAADTDKATAAENRATSAVKERTRAVKALTDAQQRLRDIASGKISPVQPGQQISIYQQQGGRSRVPAWMGAEQAAKFTDPEEAAARKAQADALRAQRNHMRGYGYTGAGLANPPPGLPTAAAPAASAFKQIAPLLAAAVGTGVGGPLGGAIAGVLTKMNPAVAAVTAAMTALRFAAHETAQAFDRARGLYAKTLASGGLAQNFITRQNILANVIGVSETQVMQYGNQIAILNEKLAFATRVISDTQPALTATAWNFKILKENMAAFWAKIAETIAPVANRFAELSSAITKLATMDPILKSLVALSAALVDLSIRLVALAELVPATITTMFIAIADALNNGLTLLNNIIAQTKFGALLGFRKEAMPGFNDTKEAYESLTDILKAIVAVPSAYEQTAPTPGSNINRLPSSTWEKMGMILGQTGGGSTNWNQRTAQGVARLVSLTERLVYSQINKADSFANPMASMA